MTTASGAQRHVAEPGGLSWRDQAVARRINAERARAENSVRRFLEAALELLNDSPPGVDFTLQQVVTKSGQSTRGFYQHFASKQELMLALFDGAVLSATAHLRELVAQQEHATDQLRVFVLEYYEICSPIRSRPGMRLPQAKALAHFGQQLLTVRPAEAARAFLPLVTLFEQVLEGASAQGAVRADLARRRVAGFVLEAIMFNAFSRAITGARDAEGREPAQELLEFVMHGIGVGARSTQTFGIK
jgi:AcrR family transcriptional regulator